jgi:hypothetical protein
MENTAQNRRKQGYMTFYTKVIAVKKRRLIIKEKRKRNIDLTFRVSEQERGLIMEKMKLAGIRNMRAYLLKMAVDGYVLRLDLSDVRDMVFLLRNATNNINQVISRV